MLFSTRWLKRYVETPDSVDELAELLTRCGMVVDDQAAHGDDVVFDLDIPSNRVDAMNHLGVAREIATSLRTELRPPESDLAEEDPPAETLSSVTIEDLEGCPRYGARLVRGVKIAPSPAWMAGLLEAIGLRPLNNIADITNFVLWEMGHPLHAFDLHELGEERIVVRRARSGERLVTLDGIERELVVEDLVIADAQRPVALAGVMGGAESAISERSTDVLLEGAWFDPRSVRRTARRLNLHTDASHRFERSPAYDGMVAALERAASLIAEIAGGAVARGLIDVAGDLPEPATAELRTERLRGLLGVEVAEGDVEEILSRLGFTVEATDAGFAVGIPSYRSDVRREEDLVEEVARHYGYDRFPATLPPIVSTEKAGTAEVLGERHLKRLCSAAGFREAMSSSLCAAADQAFFLEPGQETVAIANPISENLAVLRAHLVPGLLAATAHNVNRGQADLQLFEVGKRFLGPVVEDGVEERWALALAATGQRGRHWNGEEAGLDLFDLKGAIDLISGRQGWPAWDWQPADRPGLRSGNAAALTAHDSSGNPLATGWAGMVSQQVASGFDLEQRVWVAELDIDKLLSMRLPTPQYRPVPRFPGGVRDLALLLPDATAYTEVATTVKATAEGAELPLAGVEVVEIYRGDEIPPGHRSLTLRFTYRSDDRTLRAEEIDAAHQALTDALESDLNAQRR